VEWDPAKGAERVNDHILLSRGTSNSFLVTTPEGDVVINTGTPYQGARHRERYEQLLGRKLNVRKILLTQSHPDHMGGWGAFADDGAETIVQQDFPQIRAERNLLNDFFMPRGQRILMGLMPNPEHIRTWHFGTKEPQSPTLFADWHGFELGERRFELFSAPSGETLDSMIVWLPQEKGLFTGNSLGALYGGLPHFYTPRGDRDRSIPRFLRDIERILVLKPEMLLFGHDAPIVGAARIERDLTKIRDAVRYLHDETVKGMNAQKDLFRLMHEIKLPPVLEPQPGRGPVSWYVRSIWEEYAGWFRQESTTELYGVPPSAIWAELARLSGGPDVLAARAREHVAGGRPVEALHFTDIALSVAPNHRGAREAEIGALEQLIERTEGKPYDELGWLESRLKEAHAAPKAS
jgi:alkyl sulfatase BDS1-like metallo-beta-lactamase superfamily hydrolase